MPDQIALISTYQLRDQDESFQNDSFSSLIAISANATADVWAEREALSSIQTELAALEAMVLNARARSNSSDRTQFDYEILLSDLRKIQHGISHHLPVPMEPVVPSTINALSVNFIEHKQ